MSEEFVVSQREHLERSLHEVEGRIRSLKEDASAQGEQSSESDLGPAEDLQADVTERLDGRQTNIADLTERVRSMRRALDRIDQGVYGNCERCGRPIARERLEAQPAATLCIECQRDLEKSPGSR